MARAVTYVVDYLLLYAFIASISTIISAENADLRSALGLVRLCPFTLDTYIVFHPKMVAPHPHRYDRIRQRHLVPTR